MTSAFSFAPDDLPTPWRRAEIREGLQTVREEQERRHTRTEQHPVETRVSSDHVMVSSDNKGGRRRRH